jgi:hypothetical protein
MRARRPSSEARFEERVPEAPGHDGAVDPDLGGGEPGARLKPAAGGVVVEPGALHDHLRAPRVPLFEPDGRRSGGRHREEPRIVLEVDEGLVPVGGGASLVEQRLELARPGPGDGLAVVGNDERAAQLHGDPARPGQQGPPHELRRDLPGALERGARQLAQLGSDVDGQEVVDSHGAVSCSASRASVLRRKRRAGAGTEATSTRRSTAANTAS